MRYKCYDIRHYKCDECGSKEQHMNMHNDKICWDCNEKTKQRDVK